MLGFGFGFGFGAPIVSGIVRIEEGKKKSIRTMEKTQRSGEKSIMGRSEMGSLGNVYKEMEKPWKNHKAQVGMGER